MVDQGKLTLYYNLLSQPSRTVKAVLKIGNVEHEEVSIDIFKGENKTEDFLKINKGGMIPCIVDGDFHLGESNAILKYLCETRPSIPAHLWPTDIKHRAQVDSVLEWW